MYKREKYMCGNFIEVEEKHTGRYGAPGEKRIKRKKPTPEQIKKQNQWRRERDIRMLLEKNFKKNDYWVTVTYRKGERPEEMQQAIDDNQKLFRKLRAEYRKRGQELKAIKKIEIGSRGGIHHHLVLNRIPELDMILRKIWDKGAVVAELIRGASEDFRKLASYIAKRPDTDNAIKDVWYSRTKNLEKPIVQQAVMHRKTFTRKIQVPKGWKLDEQSVREGINSITGHPYRYYTLCRMQC